MGINGEGNMNHVCGYLSQSNLEIFIRQLTDYRTKDYAQQQRAAEPLYYRNMHDHDHGLHDRDHQDQVNEHADAGSPSSFPATHDIWPKSKSPDHSRSTGVEISFDA